LVILIFSLLGGAVFGYVSDNVGSFH